MPYPGYSRFGRHPSSRAAVGSTRPGRRAEQRHWIGISSGSTCCVRSCSDHSSCSPHQRGGGLMTGHPSWDRKHALVSSSLPGSIFNRRPQADFANNRENEMTGAWIWAGVTSKNPDPKTPGRYTSPWTATTSAPQSVTMSYQIAPTRTRTPGRGSTYVDCPRPDQSVCTQEYAGYYSRDSRRNQSPSRFRTDSSGKSRGRNITPTGWEHVVPSSNGESTISSPGPSTPTGDTIMRDHRVMDDCDASPGSIDCRQFVLALGEEAPVDDLFTYFF
jgi:hypothetical protein